MHFTCCAENTELKDYKFGNKFTINVTSNKRRSCESSVFGCLVHFTILKELFFIGPKATIRFWSNLLLKLVIGFIILKFWFWMVLHSLRMHYNFSVRCCEKRWITSSLSCALINWCVHIRWTSSYSRWVFAALFASFISRFIYSFSPLSVHFSRF